MAAMNTAAMLDSTRSATPTRPSMKILAMSSVITLLAKISTMVNTVAKIACYSHPVFWVRVLLEARTRLVQLSMITFSLTSAMNTAAINMGAMLNSALFSNVGSSQHKDLGDELGDHLLGGDQHNGEHSGEDRLQRNGVFSKGLDEVIGTFLHLVLTPCILGESIIGVQPKLNSASNLTRPRM